MAYETPSFEKYKMPTGKFASAVTGLYQGIDEAMKTRRTLDELENAKLTRGKITQEMKQAEEMHPLKLKELDTKIQEMLANTSLVPAHKALLFAQAQHARAEAANVGVSKEPEYFKVLKAIDKETDPNKKKQYQEYADAILDKARKSGQSAGEIEAVKDQSKDFAQGEKAARESANSARDYVRILDNFKAAYDKTSYIYKGKYKIPDLIRPADADNGNVNFVDKLSSDLQLHKFKQQGSTRLAGVFAAAKDSQMNRSMSQETIDQLYPQAKISAQRDAEKVHFYPELRKKGILDGAEVESMWDDYNKKYPELKSGEPVPNNLGKWKDYISERFGEKSSDTDIVGLDKWLEIVRPLNKGVSDNELIQHYNQKYGKK